MSKPNPNFIILYVADPGRSADFYADLLEAKPVEASPTFAMFALPSGVMLGLWKRAGVEPAPSAPPGGGELAFTVPDAATVAAVQADWQRRGLRIIQAPTAMDFGHTFTAEDPDGHRLRVFVPTPS
jgi:catechol 2,3-dioxygenase-like lactoylglutathione lyase family enzyme